MTDKISHVKQLCFVDIETTGLDPKLDQIIEVAAAVLDLDSDQVVASYQSLVKFSGPLPDFHAGKFEGVDWTLATPLGEVLRNLHPLIRGRAIAGQNPKFDLSFLVPYYESLIGPWPADYHSLDTATIGHTLHRLGLTEGVSLRYTRKWAGRPDSQAHRAMADVEDAIAVYRKFYDRIALWAFPLGAP